MQGLCLQFCHNSLSCGYAVNVTEKVSQKLSVKQDGECTFNRTPLSVRVIFIPPRLF